MTESNPVVWRLNADNKWHLFNNTQFQLPVVKDEKAKTQKEANKKTNKKEKKTPFYFAKIKAETKGSLVYTPKGYGIIQAIKPDANLIAVKVNNEVQDYNKYDVTNEIPMCLTYISNSGKREDKTILPIHSTAKDIIERIENDAEGDTPVATRIFFNGKELIKSSDTLEKMGIKPFSKFLIIASLGKPHAVNRFPTVCQGWGFSSSSVDGVTFSPSKDVRVIGFGIYTPENDATVTGIAKFIQGNDAKGTPVYTKEVSITRNDLPEDKIWRFIFDRPVRVKASEMYCCVLEMKNGNTFYGSGGLYSVVGESDVTFSFTECTGSYNGTGPSSGQIPEIYYYA